MRAPRFACRLIGTSATALAPAALSRFPATTVRGSSICAEAQADTIPVAKPSRVTKALRYLVMSTWCFVRCFIVDQMYYKCRSSRISVSLPHPGNFPSDPTPRGEIALARQPQAVASLARRRYLRPLRCLCWPALQSVCIFLDDPPPSECPSSNHNVAQPYQSLSDHRNCGGFTDTGVTGTKS